MEIMIVDGDNDCVCVCVYNVSMLLSNNNNIGGSDYKNYIMLFIFFFSLTP